MVYQVSVELECPWSVRVVILDCHSLSSSFVSDGSILWLYGKEVSGIRKDKHKTFDCIVYHPGKPHVQISEGVGYRR